jgi:hypothetical protein
MGELRQPCCCDGPPEPGTTTSDGTLWCAGCGGEMLPPRLMPEEAAEIRRELVAELDARGLPSDG